jgi:hypothetical protein
VDSIHVSAKHPVNMQLNAYVVACYFHERKNRSCEYRALGGGAPLPVLSSLPDVRIVHSNADLANTDHIATSTMANVNLKLLADRGAVEQTNRALRRVQELGRPSSDESDAALPTVIAIQARAPSSIADRGLHLLRRRRELS